MTSTSDAWSGEAENWIAWVRRPWHDAYWWYSPLFFDQIVPESGRSTLEIGCGEGRVSRDLQARGHSTTGVDVVDAMLAAAREADPAGTYVRADAAALPFHDAAFDVVVAYNSLMDVDDLPGAVREAARVLQPDGRFCICITHPLMDAGRFARKDADAPFVIDGSYFETRRLEATFERAGLTITFHSWCYPLETYTRALEDAGFLIELLREASVPEEDARQARIPLFLFLRAIKAG